MIDFDYMILRLFILRIGKGKTDAEYRVAYGVVSPATSKMTEAFYTDFTTLGTFGKRCAWNTILFASDTGIILSIYEDLLKGISVKDAFTRHGIDVSKMGYDVTYSQDYEPIPWAEEHITEMQINYTKAACMLEPERLFEVEGIDDDSANKALGKLIEVLAGKLRVSNVTMKDRIGNLEIIVTPAKDANGRSLVECSMEKGTPFVQKVKILSELSDKYNEITVNVRLVTAGRLFNDSLKRESVVKGQDMEFGFESQNPISTSYIKVWGKKGDECILIHYATYHIIRRIVVNAEMIGARIKAETGWIKKIRANANEKQNAIVDKATVIEHRASEKTVIGNSSSPKWAKRYVKPKPVVKSNDEYFHNGWDNSSDENGGLGFLAWFKRKAKGADDVFIHDPYFEDVALYFIASADIESSYTVLTQTRLKTNSDGTDTFVPEEEISERREKIRNTILKNPTLFQGMRLVVKDVPAADNKLHDRYIIFSYSDGGVEAYTLSNSIQGATMKRPLLVTQIGDNAYVKLKAYLEKMLDSETLDVIYDYKKKEILPCDEVSEIADPGFYSWMCEKCRKPSGYEIEEILDDAIKWNTVAKISTLGYWLATTPESLTYQKKEKSIAIIKSEKVWIDALKDFVLDKHYSKYPIGFIDCPHNGFRDQTPCHLIGKDYETIVSRDNIDFLEYAGMEGGTYRVWGQYFACEMLVRVSPYEAIDTLKQLSRTLLTIENDRRATPVFKISNMLLSALFSKAAFPIDKKILDLLLSDDEKWCRALGALIILFYSRKSDFYVEEYLGKIQDTQELKHVCKTAWSLKSRMANMTTYYSHLIAAYESVSDSNLVLHELLSLLIGGYHLEDKVDLVEKVIKPLISKGLFSVDDVCKDVIEGLYARSIIEDQAIRLRGVLPTILHCLDGECSMLVVSARNTLKLFERDVNSMLSKGENEIFNASREVINLRNMFRDMLRLYGNSDAEKIEEIKKVLTDVDSSLDKFGLDKTKVMFE